jgi:hypothetical protein
VREEVRTAMRTPSSAIQPDLLADGQPYYGAMFVQLAVACAATFRRTDHRGGCNGARIRFPPEATWSENAGLDKVLQVLRPVKDRFGPGLTWADLIVFAAQVAIEDAAGLALPFCPGRSDALDGAGSAFLQVPAALLYSATQTQIEQGMRMSGLNWTETVALYGRPRSPVLLNLHGLKPLALATDDLNGKYFRVLIHGWDKGGWRRAGSQYRLWRQEVYATVSDLSMLSDEDLLPIAQQFAVDEGYFRRAFAAAWTKLVSLDRFNGPTGNLCPQYT